MASSTSTTPGASLRVSPSDMQEVRSNSKSERSWQIRETLYQVLTSENEPEIWGDFRTRMRKNPRYCTFEGVESTLRNVGYLVWTLNIAIEMQNQALEAIQPQRSKRRDSLVFVGRREELKQENVSNSHKLEEPARGSLLEFLSKGNASANDPSRRRESDSSQSLTSSHVSRGSIPKRMQGSLFRRRDVDNIEPSLAGGPYRLSGSLTNNLHNRKLFLSKDTAGDNAPCDSSDAKSIHTIGTRRRTSDVSETSASSCSASPNAETLRNRLRDSWTKSQRTFFQREDQALDIPVIDAQLTS